MGERVTLEDEVNVAVETDTLFLESFDFRVCVLCKIEPEQKKSVQTTEVGEWYLMTGQCQHPVIVHQGIHGFNPDILCAVPKC